MLKNLLYRAINRALDWLENRHRSEPETPEERPPGRGPVLGIDSYSDLTKPAFSRARGEVEHPYQDFLATLPEISVPTPQLLKSPSVETLASVIIDVADHAASVNRTLIDLSGEDGYHHLLYETVGENYTVLENARLLLQMLDPQPKLAPIVVPPDLVERGKRRPS